MTRLRLTAAALAVFGWFAAPPAEAAYIITLTDTVTPLPGGLFRYEYVLAVDPASDFGAASLTVDVALGSGPTDFTSPAGWTVDYTPVDTAVYWNAPFDGSGDIPPGSSGTFAFTTPFGPGPQAYSSLGINPATGAAEFADGTTVGPTVTPGSAVPEPASLALLGVGAVGLALRARRRARTP